MCTYCHVIANVHLTENGCVDTNKTVVTNRYLTHAFFSLPEHNATRKTEVLAYTAVLPDVNKRTDMKELQSRTNRVWVYHTFQLPTKPFEQEKMPKKKHLP